MSTSKHKHKATRLTTQGCLVASDNKSTNSNAGTKERRNEGTKERRNEGTKERRDEGTKERRNEGTTERRNEGTKERRQSSVELGQDDKTTLGRSTIATTMAQRPVQCRRQKKSWKVGRHLSLNAFRVPLELWMLANARVNANNC